MYRQEDLPNKVTVLKHGTHVCIGKFRCVYFVSQYFIDRLCGLVDRVPGYTTEI
jgi:hypothetical protein